MLYKGSKKMVGLAISRAWSLGIEMKNDFWNTHVFRHSENLKRRKYYTLIEGLVGLRLFIVHY